MTAIIDDTQNFEGRLEADAANELLQAIIELMSKSEGGEGMTRKEIQDKLRINERKALSLLNELDQTGKIEPVRVYRRNISGVLSPRPAYKLKDDESSRENRLDDRQVE